MSGHSHWATIKHKKGAVDAKRGKLWSKLSRAIIIAAKNGGGDPTMNLKLRYAIDKAREVSMPKDNIERAIKRGTGEMEGVVFEEITYEGYGPGGVAILVEAMTDNPNRTTPEIRHIFEKNSGNLGTPGSVRFQFERKGYFAIEKKAVDEDKLMEIALEAGADDLQTDLPEAYEVYTSPDSFEAVRQALEKNKIGAVEAKMGQIPQVWVKLDDAKAKQTARLLEMLDDHDDVQNVWSNFDVPAEMMESA